MKNKRVLIVLILVFIATTLLVSFQNCSNKDMAGKYVQDFARLSSSGGNGPGGPPGSTPTPPEASPTPGGGDNFTEAIDPECMTKQKYDACIFKKNPVAQKGSVFSPAATYSTNMSAIQTFGVKITGTTGGFLENANYKVTITGKNRARPDANGKWKYTYASDPDHRVGQVMAYFWLNKQANEMKEKTGAFGTIGKVVNVEALDESLINNAYWLYKDASGNIVKRIVMGKTTIGGQNTENALSADIYCHEAGHANLTYLSNFTGYSSATHVACGNSYCCTSKNGCLGAINEGQADVHAGILFSDSPNMGEMFFNSMNGMTTSGCGGNLKRNPAANPTLTAQGAYQDCPTKNGEFHAAGVIYSSIWWEVRKRAGAGAQEVDKIFTDHIKALTSDDTFLTALNKIKASDRALFNGKYSASFDQEYQRAGLQ